MPAPPAASHLRAPACRRSGRPGPPQRAHRLPPPDRRRAVHGRRGPRVSSPPSITPCQRARLPAGDKRGKPRAIARMEPAMAELPAREAMDVDVVIIGAGPAGLAAAIRLKHLAPDTSVLVVEKGSEVGAHILSGAVIDPIALDRLLPECRGEETPIKQPVTADRFYWLSESRSLRLPNWPMPPLMNNHGNFLVFLGHVLPWLGA